MSRQNLALGIPLARPWSMFVEPTNVCNFKCPICPESFADYAKQAGYYSKMPRWVWQRLIESMHTWGLTLKVLRFYFEGEPLLNPDLPEMIEEAKRYALAERLEVTTNGSMLYGDMAKRLVSSGLDYIRISVYGTRNSEYELMAGSHYKLSRVINNATEFRVLRDRVAPNLQIHAQLVNHLADEQAFYRQWRPIADQCDVKTMHNWGSADSRLVQLGQRPTAPMVCSRLFYEMAVHANGDVSTCCVDWNSKLLIGDILTNSLEEIWQGETLARIKRMHLEGRRGEIAQCAGCTIPAQQLDNLDHLVRTEPVTA